jgi:hypothetical protein
MRLVRQNDIVIENTSGSDITVNSISITGTDFTISEDCGATIPAGGSCTISVTGENQADETLTISLNGTARQVPVSMGAIAEATPAPDPTPEPAPAPTPIVLARLLRLLHLQNLPLLGFQVQFHRGHGQPLVLIR